MKNKFVKILGLVFAFFVVLSACEKPEQEKLDDKLATWNYTNLTSTSVDLSGFVVAQGDGFVEYGVCWNTAANPTVDDQTKVADEVDKAVFHVVITDLEHLTKYYAKAYIKKADGAYIYGEEVSFTTLANLATISVSAATAITATSATVAGDAPYDGKALITEKGVCYATTENPTTANSIVKGDVDEGTFSVNLAGLRANTTYYARGYAKNSVGTAYSTQITFTTLIGVASVENTIGEITKTTAIVNGNVTYDGGANVTERGFVWSTSANPTTADSKQVITGTTGVYSFEISGLDKNTDYYVSAYAINSIGTAYSASTRFTTLSDLYSLYVPGGYQVASGYSTDNWKPELAPTISNTLEAPNMAEGYVYFASANEFKLTSHPDWDHTNYGGAAGILDPTAGNLSVAEAGLYKITANILVDAGEDMTYSVQKMEWRLIGGAIGSGNWSDEVDMVYNKSLKRLVATTTMLDSEFKFRANHQWDPPAGFNYGDNNTNGSLEAGGANIPVDAGVFTVIMDLSQRNYTYAVTQWGVIGDAVGGWSSDHNMTPVSGTNKWSYTGAFTVGEFKFRANDDWPINLGGSTTALTFGGGNIKIETAGTYTVVLDLETATFTITAAAGK